ncbi:UNVERIFIED_CONTAM: hypothetical protein FKN15_018654 [Acipenser sinensis]
MGLISFVVLALLLLGESVSSDDDDDEEFTVTDGTITLCPKHGDSSLSRWLSQRSDVSVSLWLLSYTELERNVWCSEDQYAECRGTPDPAPQHARASGDYENLPPGAPEQQSTVQRSSVIITTLWRHLVAVVKLHEAVYVYRGYTNRQQLWPKKVLHHHLIE